MEREKGAVTEEDLNEVVTPGSSFLHVFDETRGGGGAAIIKEVRKWYAHTASDLLHMMNSGDEAWGADARQFLERFSREVGFDFFAEAGLLRKVANKALGSGKIARQGDYHSLKELENDLSQSVLSSEELAEISKLLRDYENRLGVR